MDVFYPTAVKIVEATYFVISCICRIFNQSISCDPLFMIDFKEWAELKTKVENLFLFYAVVM